MEQFWNRSITGLTIAVTALAMLAINSAFEAAGSIPDFENCGFLAGNLAALALLYPVITALIASKTVRLTYIFDRTSDSHRLLRLARGTGFGAALYFAAGLAFTVGSSGRMVPIPVCLICVAYVLLSFVGGWVGAAMGARTTRRLAWNES
jgi:hypothetical protein